MEAIAWYKSTENDPKIGIEVRKTERNKGLNLIYNVKEVLGVPYSSDHVADYIERFGANITVKDGSKDLQNWVGKSVNCVFDIQIGDQRK